jgi:FkbM family methyltransferase
MQSYLRNLKYTLRVIATHPLTREQRLPALGRWLRWQISSRLAPGMIVVPFVNNTKMMLSPGMCGATLHVYVGLGEFDEMGFLLHFLRTADLFVDIGANVGAYTVLASGVVQCRTIAFEPGPEAYERLQLNIHLNHLAGLVKCHAQALSNSSGVAAFTRNLDTLNHIIPPSSENAVSDKGFAIPTITMDAALAGQHPTLMKIDVEGHESFVIDGGPLALADASLQALIVEINENCERYRVTQESVFDRIAQYGFRPCEYNPLKRELIERTRQEWLRTKRDNTIWIRDQKLASERLRTAVPFTVLGKEI